MTEQPARTHMLVAAVEVDEKLGVIYPMDTSRMHTVAFWEEHGGAVTPISLHETAVAEAEKRGAAKALRVEAARGLEAAEKASERDSPFTDFAVHLMQGLAGELARRADAIESGEVTL